MTREAGLTEPVKDAASPEFFIGGLDALGMSVPSSLMTLAKMASVAPSRRSMALWAGT
jgi:hypothetical protein